MNDYSAIVDAIDRLIATVNQNSNTLTAECISTFLATVGSVAAVLVFELIKNSIITPRAEFRKLQRNVNSTLSLYSCYYSNPITPYSVELIKDMNEKYSHASFELRKLATDVIAFADERKKGKCCGIPVKDIREAGSNLIGLSNSFFSTGDPSDRDYTKKKESEIKRLLGLVKD